MFLETAACSLLVFDGTWFVSWTVTRITDSIRQGQEGLAKITNLSVSSIPLSRAII